MALKILAYGSSDSQGMGATPGRTVNPVQSGQLYRIERGFPFLRAGKPVVATPQFKSLVLYTPNTATIQVATNKKIQPGSISFPLKGKNSPLLP